MLEEPRKLTSATEIDRGRRTVPGAMSKAGEGSAANNPSRRSRVRAGGMVWVER